MKAVRRFIRLSPEESKHHRPIEHIIADLQQAGYVVERVPGIENHPCPLTYWVHTNVSVQDLRRAPGVFDAI